MNNPQPEFILITKDGHVELRKKLHQDKLASLGQVETMVAVGAWQILPDGETAIALLIVRQRPAGIARLN